MTLAPLSDGAAELCEKRSRFIGSIRRAATEEAALEHIRQLREKYYDAKHHAFAYVADDCAARYSDDGEPGGSAGLPIMNLLKSGGVSQVSCVVTRYFGGILLGVGGLRRAYTEAARRALDAAGLGELRELRLLEVTCPYSFYERVARYFGEKGISVGGADFSELVKLSVWLDETELAAASPALINLTLGTAGMTVSRETRSALRPIRGCGA